MLFEASEDFASALRLSLDDLDSRGTLDVAAPFVEWEHAGNTVRVEQQAGCLSDTAAVVWLEAIVTAQWLAATCTLRASLGATLELGAGTGFLGLWCARAGLASSMVLSDRPSRVPFLQRNVNINLLGTPLSVVGLAWGDESGASLLKGKIDTILASSLIYDPALHAELVITLAAIDAPRIVLTFSRRNQAAEDAFLQLLHERSYVCVLREQRTNAQSRGLDVFVYDCMRSNPPMLPVLPVALRADERA